MRTSIYGIHPGVAMSDIDAEVMRWLKRAHALDA